MEKNNQKALAFIACFAILLLYKSTVWDPYFYGRGQTSTNPPVNTGGALPEAASTSELTGRTPTTVPPATSPVVQPASQAPSSPAPVSQAIAPAQAGLTQSSGLQGTFPGDQQIQAAGVFRVETDTLSVQLSYLGGRAVKLLLKDYAEDLKPESPRLNLVDHVENAPLPLGVYVNNSDEDTWVQYQLVQAPAPEALHTSSAPGSYLVRSEGEAQFVLRGRLADGREITKTLTLRGRGYLIGVGVEVSQQAASTVGQPTPAGLDLEWTKEIAKDSPSLLDPYDVAGYVWFDGQKALREQFGKLETPVLSFGSVQWAAMADKYFMAAIINGSGAAPAFGAAYGLRSGELFRMRVTGQGQRSAFELFVGPKSLELLQQAGRELPRAINFGRTAVIAAPLLQLLHFFFGLVGNYGLAIVALTILVKTALFPLNSASFKQMKAMQDLQPEVQELRDTIKDKQQQQIAMMALYKKRGVNPLGGCLPVLVQMPIFIGLYSALLIATELRHAHFAFWINDLSATERLMVGGFGIPVMVILFVLSMLVQQWITPSTMDPTQKKVMLVMPIVFGFMFANFPAGLTLYWLTNNLISIGQQKAMQRQGRKSALAVTLGVSLGVYALVWLVVLLG